VHEQRVALHVRPELEGIRGRWAGNGAIMDHAALPPAWAGRPVKGDRGARRAVALGFGLALALMSVSIWAQSGAAIHSLKSITIPKPPDFTRYVRDEKTLVALGKALFWDVQLSSDDQVACATCHFHAGADHRRQNQLSTAKDPVTLNWPLAAGDFPFGANF